MRARFVLSLCLTVAAAACAKAPDRRTFTLQGQVQSLDAPRKQVVVKHEQITGFMPAMTMPYEVEDAKALGHVFHTIRRMEKPVVALVRGRAFAGGAGLATACDIVLAHEDATFGYPEVTIGFVPAMVMTMLRRSVGEKQAFDLVSTGRILTAGQAREIGLVSRVFASSEFQGLSQAVLDQLAKQPRGAMAATKSLFYKLDNLGFLDGISAGIVANADARATSDFRAGVKRFTARTKET